MENKQVLLVVRTLAMGGMERMTVNLANALVRQGHSVHLLVYKNRLELKPDPDVVVHVADFDRWFRATIIGLVYELTRRAVMRIYPGTRDFLYSLYFSPLFRFWLRRKERLLGRRFDLIVARGFGSFQGLGCVSDDRLVRVIVNQLWPRSLGLPERSFYRGSFDGAKVFLNSQRVQDQFRALCGQIGASPRVCRVVGNPTDVEAIRRNSRVPLDFPRPYILNVGRLEKSKNQMLLVRAFARLADRIPHSLVLIGKGGLEAELRRETELLGVTDRVHFAGLQSNPYPWMKNADLFVLSSLHEGLPNVVIEALVCGTPVVVTRGKGGAVELMQGELKQYIAEPTPESMAERIAAAIDSPPQVREDFADAFSMDKVALEFLSTADTTRHSRL